MNGSFLAFPKLSLIDFERKAFRNLLKYKRSVHNVLFFYCLKVLMLYPRALEILMKGRSKNVLMQANTGTGKTIAFLLPILTRLTEDKPTPFHVCIRFKRQNLFTDFCQDIIVTPTRELAAQIYHEAIALLNPKLAKCVMAVLPPERSFEGSLLLLPLPSSSRLPHSFQVMREIALLPLKRCFRGSLQ